MDTIINLFYSFYEFFQHYFMVDIYDFFVKWFAEFIKWTVISELKVKLFFLKLSWDVGKELLNSFDVTTQLNNIWQSLDSQILQILNFLKIPEAINIILSAYSARFVFRFLGF